jgi:hypothetical protein
VQLRALEAAEKAEAAASKVLQTALLNQAKEEFATGTAVCATLNRSASARIERVRSMMCRRLSKAPALDASSFLSMVSKHLEGRSVASLDTTLGLPAQISPEQQHAEEQRRAERRRRNEEERLNEELEDARLHELRSKHRQGHDALAAADPARPNEVPVRAAPRKPALLPCGLARAAPPQPIGPCARAAQRSVAQR